MTVLIQMTLNNILDFKSEVLNLEPKFLYDCLYSLEQELEKESFNLSMKDASILNDLYNNACENLKIKSNGELDFLKFVK